jgi:hypothetical protein
VVAGLAGGELVAEIDGRRLITRARLSIEIVRRRY